MSTDSRRYRDRRDPLKRKSREASEEAAPARKKQHRKAAESFEDDEIQLEDYGSGGEGQPATLSKKNKAQSAQRPAHEYPSVNELKKRIRDVKRLLNKVDLPADARIVQERALAGYEQDLAEETARRQRSQMIKKYHFVRFLDRRTATKDLNRLLRREKEKNEELDPSGRAQLAQKIENARVNLNYTIYYPLTEKYISLYPKSKGGGHAGSDSEPEQLKQNHKGTQEAKPPLWSVVAKCTEEGTLDQLREGKLNINSNGEKINASSLGAASALATTTDKKHKDAHEHRESNAGAPRKAKHLPRRDDNQGARGGKREKSSRREREQGRGRRQFEAQMNQPQDDNEASDGGFFEE